VGEGAKRPEARRHYGPSGRICGGCMERRSRALPWEISHRARKGDAGHCAWTLPARWSEKSAEAIVAAIARRRRAKHEEPNRHERIDGP
jgi:hypothetical protein